MEDCFGCFVGLGGKIMVGGGIGMIVIVVFFFLFSGGDLNFVIDILGGG